MNDAIGYRFVMICNNMPYAIWVLHSSDTPFVAYAIPYSLIFLKTEVNSMKYEAAVKFLRVRANLISAPVIHAISRVLTHGNYSRLINLISLLHLRAAGSGCLLGTVQV